MGFKPLIAGAAALLAAGTMGILLAGTASAAPTRYEAENSPAVCTGTIDNNWAPFSGTGFCNGNNAVGAFIQFTVNAAAAGTATLGFRFANGTTTVRPAQLIVNGATVQTPSFEGTGAWNTWITKTLTASVNAGSNTIRLNPTTSNGLANIDFLDFEVTGTPPSSNPPSSPPPAGNTLFAAPNGVDSAPGTQASPTTVASAITRIAAGGTIFLRGGTYNLSQTITIAPGNNGTSSARKTLAAFQSERPILNFSAQSAPVVLFFVTRRQQRLVSAAAERRRAKRNRILSYGGGLVIVGLLVAIVVAVVNAVGGPSTAGREAPTKLVTPANTTAAGAIAIGNPTAPVKVEVYLDYMCPFCGRFDRANDEELNRLIADGTMRLEVHLMSFLDRASSGTRYSTRAANAVATVADRAPDKVLAFNRALFAQQPHEGSTGLSDAQIADIARGAGVQQDVIDAFADRTFEPWIGKVTEAAFASGVNSTPTVKVNGVVFKGDLLTAGPLTEAINAAKGL